MYKKSFTAIATLVTLVFALTSTQNAAAQNFRLPGNVGSIMQRVGNVMGQAQGFSGQNFQQQGFQGQSFGGQTMGYFPQQQCNGHTNRPPVQVLPYQPPVMVQDQIVSTAPVPQPTKPAQPKLTEEQQKLVEARQRVASAKQLFKAEKYDEAIAQLDKVVELMPKDSNGFQFRAAAYFAKGDFEKAAADVYDGIQLGNLWNWNAMQGIYAKPELYTAHLRKLEASVKEVKDSMPTRFLLAYQYLVLEHLDHGAQQLKKVLEINPKEPVSTKLLAVIESRNQKPVSKK